MWDYFPSEGDLPPPRWVFPPPDQEFSEPTLQEDISHVRPWDMVKTLPMQKRWESLAVPRMHGKGGPVSPD